MRKYTFSDVKFKDIPEVFAWRYGEWIAMWLRNYSRWGSRCYFPLQYSGDRVLAGLGELNDHGNPHAVIISLYAHLSGELMVISPYSVEDRELIRRHAAILRQ